MAPASLDLETINLSGLADRSVSVEVIQPGDVLDVTMVTDYAKLTTTDHAAPRGRRRSGGCSAGWPSERGGAGGGAGRTGAQRREHRAGRVPHSLHHA